MKQSIFEALLELVMISKKTRLSINFHAILKKLQYEQAWLVDPTGRLISKKLFKYLKLYIFQFHLIEAKKGSNILRFVPLPLIPKEKCVKPHTKYLPEEITSSMVCAGYLKGKKDTCQVKLKFSSFKLSQEVFPTPIQSWI